MIFGYVQNLMTLTPTATTVAGQWFQDRAAIILNHLYRRAALPETRSIYRSRLPELWLNHHKLEPALNALTPASFPALEPSAELAGLALRG
jgi:hypothetical protein